MTRAAAACEGKKARCGRGAFGALLFALSLVLHLAVGGVRASPAESAWLCAESIGHSHAARDADAPRGDARSGLSHCSDCAMTQSPTLPSNLSIAGFEPIPARFADFGPLRGVALEKRRAGETLARAPPLFS